MPTATGIILTDTNSPLAQLAYGRQGSIELVRSLPHTSYLLYQLLINGFTNGLALGTNMELIVNVFDMCANSIKTDE